MRFELTGEEGRSEREQESQARQHEPLHAGDRDATVPESGCGRERRDRRDQPVADASNGFDDARVVGVVVEAFPKVGNAPGQRFVDHDRVRPHGSEQRLARDHPAGGLGQHPQYRQGFRIHTAGYRASADASPGGFDEPVSHQKTLAANTYRVFLGALLLMICANGCDASNEEEAYTVDSIAVASEAASIARGAKEQLTVTVLTTERQPVSDPPVEWRSSDPSVITVDETGIITAVSRGEAMITATLQGKSDAETMTVVDIEGFWLAVYRSTRLPGPDSIRYALSQDGRQVQGTFRSTYGFPPITDRNTGTITGILDLKRFSKTFEHTVRIPAAPCNLVFTGTFTLETRTDGRLVMKPLGDGPLTSDNCSMLNGRITFADLVYQS